MPRIGKAKGFVNRGDPQNYDFSITNFTCDETWRDLDFSAIVPSNAKAVLIRGLITSNTIGAIIRLRKKGQTYDRNRCDWIIQIAGIAAPGLGIIPIDPTGKLQYFATNTTFTDIYLIVLGWWI